MVDDLHAVGTGPHFHLQPTQVQGWAVVLVEGRKEGLHLLLVSIPLI